jgi:hypothetical protein
MPLGAGGTPASLMNVTMPEQHTHALSRFERDGQKLSFK